MNPVLGGALFSLGVIIFSKFFSKTDQKIRALVGELVIYQSSEGKELAGSISEVGGQLLLSHLLRENELELSIDAPKSVRRATIEEKREIVKALGFKHAAFTVPIWSYGWRQWNLLLRL